jgi:hypothetical protein
MPPNAEAEDYELFGRILLTWGYVEGHLANIVLRLWHPCFDIGKFNGVPNSFGQMLSLAHKGYKQNTHMSPFSEEARKALEALPPIHEKRNIIAHGRYQGLTGWTFLFVIYRKRKGAEHPSEQLHEFSRSDLDNILHDIELATAAMEDLSARTFAVPLPLLPRRVSGTSGPV